MPDAAATWSPAPDLDGRWPAPRFHEIRRFAGIDSTNRYLLAEAAAGSRRWGRRRRRRADRGPRPPRTNVECGARRRAARVGAAAARAGGRTPPPRDAGRRGCRGRGGAAVGGFEARLKWPNDLVVADRKLAGILAEADGAGAVVVGMGLNVRADAFPAELARSSPPRATCTRRPRRPGRPAGRVVDAPSTRNSTRSTGWWPRPRRGPPRSAGGSASSWPASSCQRRRDATDPEGFLVVDRRRSERSSPPATSSVTRPARRDPPPAHAGWQVFRGRGRGW